MIFFRVRIRNSIGVDDVFTDYIENALLFISIIIIYAPFLYSDKNGILDVSYSGLIDFFVIFLE